MDATESFVTRQNISRFIDRLAFEQDTSNRRILSHLLLAEEDRFARAAGHADAIEGWIGKCDVHIARHEALMEKADARGVDLSHGRQVIQTMNDIKAILLSLRQTLEKRLDSAAEELLRKRPASSSKEA